MALPTRYRRRLRTTISLERLNQKIRRQKQVIRIFSEADSVLWPMGALLMEQDEDWSTRRRSQLQFSLRPCSRWKRIMPAAATEVAFPFSGTNSSDLFAAEAPQREPFLLRQSLGRWT